MLPRKTYNKVLSKVIEHYWKQEQADRKDHPERTPIDWKSSIQRGIESCIREDGLGYNRAVAEQAANDTIDYLIKIGKLVPYIGGVQFPGRELPTREQIIANAEKVAKEFGNAIKQPQDRSTS